MGQVDVFWEVPKEAFRKETEMRTVAGFGFEFGFPIGAAYHCVKGYTNSDPSLSKLARLRKGATFARANCLHTAGALTALFLIGDVGSNALAYYRHKIDPLNNLVAFGTVAALATARRGPLVASCAAFGVGTTIATAHHCFVNSQVAYVLRVMCDRKTAPKGKGYEDALGRTVCATDWLVALLALLVESGGLGGLPDSSEYDGVLTSEF